MKTNDNISAIQSEIDSKRRTINEIKEGIAGVESEIRELSNKIAKYTDVDNVKGYRELKDNLEVRENKLELLKRNLQAELNNQDQVHIREVLSEIMREKRILDDKYGAEMLEIILKLKEKYDEAESVRERIAALYEDYLTAFNVPRNNYQSYDPVDETGMTANVSRLINSLRSVNKL